MSGSTKPPQAIHVLSVNFLREQDGAPERLLKSRLVELFARHVGVRRAYLAQIGVEDRVSVALCVRMFERQKVRGEDGPEDQVLLREIGAIFSAIFGAHEHLDILFLSDEQEASLNRVCMPFFSVPIAS